MGILRELKSQNLRDNDLAWSAIAIERFKKTGMSSKTILSYLPMAKDILVSTG